VTGAPIRRRPWLSAFAVLSLVFGLAGSASAEPDEPAPDVEVPPATKAASVPAVSEADSAGAVNQSLPPLLEHMGPETFPGRLRGLRGGSLWLEPSFHGLQWPQNRQTGLGVSAQLWVDSGYEAIQRSSLQLPNTHTLLDQGRALLRLTPAYVRGRFFLQSQLELVGNVCQSANNVCLNTGTFTTDDLWIRLGEWNRWDVKVGRFEGWEVYHLGMGMDVNTVERLGAGMFGVDPLTTPRLEAPTLYGVNYLHDRPSEGFGLGYAAVHLYPTDSFRLEVLAKLGTDNFRADNSTGTTPFNYVGGRPTAIFDLGWLKFKVGGEYQQRTPTTQTVEPGLPPHKKDAVAKHTQKGVGASLQFVFDPIVEFGFNAAIGVQRDTDPFARQVPENSFTTKSVGGFANVRLADLWLAGIGLDWTTQTDLFTVPTSTDNDFVAHIQSFAALQYLVEGQLYIKAVFGFARAAFLPADPTSNEWRDYMYSGRIRLMYLY